jgi:predicted Zn finger-like uncharacterized protein
MPEIVNCPQCERQLRVPEELIGKKVKCPTCGSTFAANISALGQPGGASATTATREEPPRRQPDEDIRADDRPSRRAARPDVDEEEERPSRRGNDDEPIRRRLEPHRGTLILVFGILSLVLGFLICALFFPGFGIPAWIMGNGDLRKMRAGQMDPEGESMTNIGRILGMVSTGLCVLGLICGLLYLVVFVVIRAMPK